jgi:hypothetical protein
MLHAAAYSVSGGGSITRIGTGTLTLNFVSGGSGGSGGQRRREGTPILHHVSLASARRLRPPPQSSRIGAFGYASTQGYLSWPRQKLL